MRLDSRISRLMTESDLTVEEARRALDLMFLAEEWRRTRVRKPHDSLGGSSPERAVP